MGLASAELTYFDNLITNRGGKYIAEPTELSIGGSGQDVLIRRGAAHHFCLSIIIN